jgi:hypothetical protein
MASGFLTLSSFGGSFIEHRPSGRPMMSFPISDDEADEDRFLNANDYRSDFVPIEDIGFEMDFGDEPERSTDGMVGLRLSQKQIDESALVMAENPELLVEMYRENIAILDGYPEKDLPSWHAAAREYFINFMRSTFAAVIAAESPTQVNRTFCSHLCPEPQYRFKEKRDERTVLHHLTRFARQEAKQKMAHAVALPIMRTLGHDDVFARYLD